MPNTIIILTILSAIFLQILLMIGKEVFSIKFLSIILLYVGLYIFLALSQGGFTESFGYFNSICVIAVITIAGVYRDKIVPKISIPILFATNLFCVYTLLTINENSEVNKFIMTILPNFNNILTITCLALCFILLLISIFNKPLSPFFQVGIVILYIILTTYMLLLKLDPRIFNFYDLNFNLFTIFIDAMLCTIVVCFAMQVITVIPLPSKYESLDQSIEDAEDQADFLLSRFEDLDFKTAIIQMLIFSLIISLLFLNHVFNFNTHETILTIVVLLSLQLFVFRDSLKSTNIETNV